jgi:hypothetical protein
MQLHGARLHCVCCCGPTDDSDGDVTHTMREGAPDFKLSRSSWVR